MSERADIAAVGAVLAGGLGSRLGGSKAVAELAGRPLIEYPLGALAAAGLEPLVVAKPDTELPHLDAEIVREPALPRHPLCGIVAALRRAVGRPTVVVACDMPFLSAPLLAWLASAPQPLIVPTIGGELQPLPARYEARLLPALEVALEELAPLRRTVESLRPRRLTERELARFGNPQRLCFNVNTPADLDAAARLLAPANR